MSDIQKKINETYVAHIGSSVTFVGTKDECVAYRESLPYATDSWKINDIEEFGFDCYSEGYDSGYESGANQAVEY